MTSSAFLGQLGTPSCLIHPLSSSEQDLLWDWFPFADLTPSRGPILHPTHAQLLTLASTLRPCSSFWVSCSLWLLRILDPTQGLGLGFPTSRSCPFSLPTSNLLSRRPASGWCLGATLSRPVPDPSGQVRGTESHEPGLPLSLSLPQALSNSVQLSAGNPALAAGMCSGQSRQLL